MQSPVGGKASDTTDLIGAVATLIMAATHSAMAPVVAFAAWALKSGVNLWCEQYGKRQYDGKGSYEIDINLKFSGDLSVPMGTKALDGTFVVTYFPAIERVVRDPKFTQPVHEVKIDQDARAEGRFIPDSTSSIATIVEYWDTNHVHRFAFSDTVSGDKIHGRVDLEQPPPVGSDLPFVSESVTKHSGDES